MASQDRKNVEPVEGGAHQPNGKPRAPKRRRGVIAGVVVVAVAVLAVGVGAFSAYASSSDYCMSMCHTPLDGYVETYNQDAGVEGTDKWGNVVSNTSSMLATTHRDWNAADCATCHPQDLNRRLTEVGWWLTGDYYYPLEEWKSADMAEHYGVEEDALCLNEACHNMTRDELRAQTNDTRLNPHSNRHGDISCSTCHKAHRASVLQCAGCHDEAEVPSGWLTPSQEESLITWRTQAEDLAGLGADEAPADGEKATDDAAPAAQGDQDASDDAPAASDDAQGGE